jgi:hypothetical protein
VRAGPELDAEIAKTLWGYLIFFDTHTGEHSMMGPGGRATVPILPYSTSKEAVAHVTDYYENRGWKLRTRKDGSGYVAAFVRKDDNRLYRFISAETLPEAICRAALAVANGTNIQSK